MLTIFPLIILESMYLIICFIESFSENRTRRKKNDKRNAIQKNNQGAAMGLQNKE